jgi:hypothetical protein
MEPNKAKQNNQISDFKLNKKLFFLIKKTKNELNTLAMHQTSQFLTFFKLKTKK